MKNKKKSIQYTVRSVPEEVDRALRSSCARENRSLNEYVIDTLKSGAGLSNVRPEFHDLDYLSGSWVQDELCDMALAEFDKVEEGMWK